MSGLGTCYDNAQAAAFFSTLKTECFPDNQVFSSRAQARREIFEYIELYYNNRRLHSALGYQTPCRYETQFKRVIDTEIDLAQSLDVATEDRALRGNVEISRGPLSLISHTHTHRIGPAGLYLQPFLDPQHLVLP
jgi:hypothetical protein